VTQFRHQQTIDDAAQAMFLAGLPTGKNGEPSPGHTTWEMLGPDSQKRHRRMTEAVIDSLTARGWEPPGRFRISPPNYPD
jgi:hypothetical protein